MENLLYRSKYINDKCFFPRIRILSAQRTDSDRQQRLHWDEDANDKLTSYYCTTNAPICRLMGLDNKALICACIVIIVMLLS